MNTPADTAPPDGPRAINGREALAAARLQLLAATRHRLVLHLPLLGRDDYGNDAELAELKRIATSGRRAEIRILLHDPAAALRDGHRLVLLFQRLSSSMAIRTPVDEVDSQNTAAWLVNDTGGYLYLPEASQPQGRMTLADRPGQVPLQQQFDAVWERSARASELSTLDL